MNDAGLGIGVTVSGAGLQADKTKLSAMKEAGVSSFELVLYGRPAAHDRMTGQRGSQAGTLAAARLMKRLGFKVTLTCPLLQVHDDEVEYIIRTAKAAGLECSFDIDMGPGKDGGASEPTLKLPAAALGRLAGSSPWARTSDPFLRALCSVLLPPAGGVLLHACGLVVGGKAHVFVGLSGAGKSTLAGLAASSGRAEVIDDEIVPLRLEASRFVVYGSPFWRKTRPLRIPLAGIYTLSKSRADSLVPGRGEDLLPLLLRCCLNLSHEPLPAALLLKTLAHAARPYKGTLSFSKKDASFLRLLN